MSGRILYSKQCGACGPSVAAIANCEQDYGTEWAFDGASDCSGGGCWPLNARARCKHIQYHGDSLQCCKNNNKGNSRATCDPRFTDGTPFCHDAMARFCANNIKDPDCARWLTRYESNAAKPTIKNYCSSNLTDSYCRDWCKRTGECDIAVTDYCKINPNDEICSCINAPLNENSVDPTCYSSPCIQTGYKTANMRSNVKCPDIITCNQQVNLNDSSMLIGGIKLEQNCGKKDTEINPSPTLDTSIPSTPPSPILFYILLFIIMLIVVITVGDSNVWNIFKNNS